MPSHQQRYFLFPGLKGQEKEEEEEIIEGWRSIGGFGGGFDDGF